MHSLLERVRRRNVDFDQGDILVQLVGTGNCSVDAGFVVLGFVGVVLQDLALHYLVEVVVVLHFPVEVVVDLSLVVTVVVVH